jgi:hypothetical protein
MKCQCWRSCGNSFATSFRSRCSWFALLLAFVLCPSNALVAAATVQGPIPTNETLSFLPPGGNSTFGSFFSLHLPTLVLLLVLILVALMFVWFVKVFTVDLNPANPPDSETKVKVRQMIVFCYVFMLLTLGVAISPFIFLMMLPQGVVSAVYNYMPDSPVALVVGCVHDDRPEDSHWEVVCQPRDPYMDEWLVSIGGLVLIAGGGNLAPNSAPPGTTTQPARSSDGKTTASGPSDSQQSNKPVVTNAPASIPSSSAANPPIAPPWTPDVNLTSNYWNFPTTVIHGGITVPLYFIIVALVGASISLTRRVPQYQKEFLDDSKPFAASEMREHLVLQILQFLSAPFLAIAGYILLTPVGPTTSIPLAFVAGFSSESVLTLITSAIQNFGKGEGAEPGKTSVTPP